MEFVTVANRLSELIEKLRKYVPLSISTIAVAHHIGGGKFEGNVYTDIWPQFTVVVCSYNIPGYSMKNVVCFTTTPGSASKVSLLQLYKSKLLSGEWGQKQYLHGDGDLLDYLMANLESMQTESKLGLFEGHQYHLPLPLPIPDTPEGYTVRKLEDRHAEFVASFWDYFVDDKEVYFRELIRNFHSVGLFAKYDLDKPVAWCLQYPFGQPGHLYVLEMYRRKGFASLMYAHICKSVQDEGFVPAISVDTQNHLAENLCKKLGFVQSGRFKEVLMYNTN